MSRDVSFCAHAINQDDVMVVDLMKNPKVRQNEKVRRVLETLTPVDQFAWSTHVELVGVFRR